MIILLSKFYGFIGFHLLNYIPLQKEGAVKEHSNNKLFYKNYIFKLKTNVET
jgi:hypothetical protein